MDGIKVVVEITGDQCLHEVYGVGQGERGRKKMNGRVRDMRVTDLCTFAGANEPQ